MSEPNETRVNRAPVLIGVLTRWRAGSYAVRSLGAAIAGLGGLFLVSLTG